MNEEQFLNIVSQMLLNAGYTKTRDALFEEAKSHGFKITKKEIPLSKDLEIREPDVIRRAKRNEVYWHQPTADPSTGETTIINGKEQHNCSECYYHDENDYCSMVDQYTEPSDDACGSFKSMAEA